MHKVKCAECGYLAWRNRHTGHLEEATKPVRDNGTVDGQHVFPECFVKHLNIRGECRDDPKRFRQVVNESRSCGRIITWQEGFTPKEHVEMYHQQQLFEYQRERENAQRAWELKRLQIEQERDKAEHDWREAQAERERQWRQEDKDDSDRRHKEELQEARKAARRGVWKDIALAVFGAALTVIGMLVHWVVTSKL